MGDGGRKLQSLKPTWSSNSGNSAYGSERVRRLSSRVGVRRTVLAAVSLPLIAAFGGAIAFLALTHGGTQPRTAIPIAVGIDRIAARIGFGLLQVELSGHVQTSSDDIFAALEQSDRRSLPGYDLAAARDRLILLPWIDEIEFHRNWPNTLRVNLTERTAFAVWTNPKGSFLIDRTGRELQRVSASAELADLAIAGPKANMALDTVQAIMDRHRDIASEIAEFTFIGERRWRLRLKSGAVIELPHTAPEVALDDVTSREIWVLLREGLVHSVDLRAPGRMIVRRKPKPAPTLTTSQRTDTKAARS